jgi:proliferating cell nuclear antigen
VTVKDLDSILKQADKYDQVSWILDSSDVLTIKLIGRTIREYETPLIDSWRTTPLPKLTFGASFIITKKEFENVLKNIGAKSNYIAIDATTKDQVSFSGKGDTGKASVTYPKEMLVTIENQDGVDCKANYSIEYLQKLVKALTSTMWRIELGLKSPIRITVHLSDADENCQLQFYLAPRIQE